MASIRCPHLQVPLALTVSSFDALHLRKMPRFGTLILPGPQFVCGAKSPQPEKQLHSFLLSKRVLLSSHLHPPAKGRMERLEPRPSPIWKALSFQEETFGDRGESKCSDFLLLLLHKGKKEKRTDKDNPSFPAGFMLQPFVSTKSRCSSTPPAVGAGSLRGLQESVGHAPWAGHSPYWSDSLSLQFGSHSC